MINIKQLWKLAGVVAGCTYVFTNATISVIIVKLLCESRTFLCTIYFFLVVVHRLLKEKDSKEVQKCAVMEFRGQQQLYLTLSVTVY